VGIIVQVPHVATFASGGIKASVILTALLNEVQIKIIRVLPRTDRIFSFDTIRTA
jgi:hypothetical protein